MRFETLRSELSAGLTHVAAGELAVALERGLRQVAAFLDVDRGNLDEYVDDGPGVRVSWVSPGVEALPRVADDAQFPWTAETLRRGHTVRFSRTEDLPEQAAVDRASYERVGTRSHLSIPLSAGGPILGTLSLDAVREERAWSDRLVERLRLFGEAFAGALERKRMEQALAERLRFEKLLSSLAGTFCTLAGADFDREVGRVLRRVTDFLGVAAGSVIDFTRDVRTARSSAVEEWIDVAEFPWMTARLQRGEVVIISGPDDLPEEAAVDRRSYLALRVKPQVAVPLVARGAVVGGLVFSTVGPGRATPDDLIRRLQLVGDIFAHALSRKQGDLEAQRLRQDLMHIGRVSAVGELLASLAHELNQPLTAILANAQAAQRLLAADAVDVAEMREILRDIVADDKRAHEVIRGLRLLLEKGDPDRVSLDLNDTVNEVARLVRSDALVSDVAISLDLAAGLPRVRGDRVQLQQVVLNLVLNGLESIRERRTGDRSLVIRTARDGAGAVRLEVQDSGIGIADEDRDRIFEPLYTTKAGGMGMGLAIVRRIVDAHGGRLGAADNVAGGATFHFTLRVDTEDQR